VAYDVLDYDGNGNATSQFLQAGSHTYGYDALNRLSTAAGVFGSRDYTYDANGNRMRDSSGGLKTNYTYTPASNRLTGVGDEAVTVDANGNTTVLRGLRLGYSADNRLRSVAGVADYAYNGLGQRVQKATRASGSAGQYGFGPRRLFLYGRNGELLVESGPTGQVTREYVYANGTLLAILDRVPEGANDPLFNADRDGDGAISVEDFLEWYFNAYLMADDSLEVSGDGVMDADDASTVWACASVQNSCVVASHRTSIHYVHNDHLGTPMALTDESGAKVWSATYDPFGQATVNEDVDGNGEPVTLNIRFPGQYYDQETGLHYNYFRYYDPELGRYLTSDPIGLAGGTNTFAYVVNNPLKHIDPKGLDIWTGTMINVSLNVLVVGGSISYGHIINQSTGERCFVRVLCGRGGVGVGGGMGTRHTISGFSPLCGKNLDGFSFELSGEMLPPGGPGAGGSVGGGSGVGVGVSGRPGIGIGFFLGIDVCKLEVLRCFHSPCGCGS
jgi:RHS repeat-associated protein